MFDPIPFLIMTIFLIIMVPVMIYLGLVWLLIFSVVTLFFAFRYKVNPNFNRVVVEAYNNSDEYGAKSYCEPDDGCCVDEDDDNYICSGGIYARRW